MFDYDAELRHYHARLLEAADIGVDDCVLDIGCGTGQTTRSAAGAARGGHALGVDVSAPMLARARRLTELAGLANARFELGDAQVHQLPLGRFTIGLSRFGTMFFADPVAAFTNIAGALRPGARFVQMVWQDGSRQAWRSAIRLALNDGTGAPPIPAGHAAFSMAEPAKVRAILHGAGFVDVQLTEVREPVYYGADLPGALRAIRSLRMTEGMPGNVDDAATDRALSRLRSVVEFRDDGAWFGACAWLVSARRRDPA